MLQLFDFRFSAMASDCAVLLYGDDRAEAEAIAIAAITEVARIEQRYSRYRSDSVLAEINDVAQRSGSIAVDDETAKLLDYAALHGLPTETDDELCALLAREPVVQIVAINTVL